jgi:hypothetical protein
VPAWSVMPGVTRWPYMHFDIGRTGWANW